MHPWEEQALEYYGLAIYPEDASWLLTDGKFLDGTGRRDNQADYRRGQDNRYHPRQDQRDHHAGRRSVDHRDIGRFTEPRVGGSEGMCLFMFTTGAIRLSVCSHLRQVNINVGRFPTREQLSWLLLFLKDGLQLTYHVEVPNSGRLGGSELRSRGELRAKTEISRFLLEAKEAYAVPP